MSNEPTKDTDRWNIGKSNIVQNVAVLTAVPDSK